MARPREFDEAQVLDQALLTFWSKGFDGTSIDDLVQATGLGRASLYGAFGGKEQLFARVLDHYLHKTECFDVEPDSSVSPRRALEALVSQWVVGTCPKKGPRGCFLSLAGTSGASAEFVRKTLLRSVEARQQRFARLIARGQAAGEFRTTRDPADLALLLVVLQQGVATLARAGMSNRDLSLAIEETLAHVMGD